MQISCFFYILATEIELKEIYFIQCTAIKNHFKSFNLTRKSSRFGLLVQKLC
jgi:hypothetical protein